jgi:hypothetical protein
MVYAGITLVILTGLGIIAVGIRFLLAPVATARTFGLPAWPTGDSAAWLNLKGIRDIVSGLVLLVPLALGELHLVGLLMLVAAITPLGDALTILRHHGSKTLAYAVHGATAVAVIAGGVLLLLAG